ncbi:MAG: undecaprenyl-diphosphate phosphatase [Lachnospiraceae bacterium]|nr:undecaprenyl-diphosphate phosphatase [Lachnospiraceae bacterium]
MDYIQIIKVIIIGIIEGITEWLPVSSTGHMILFESFVSTGFSEDFSEMFNVVIQLGAILAVVTLSFSKLNPFSGRKTAEEKKDTWSLWGKVIIGCIPAGIAGVLFDDWFDEHLYRASVVAVMLIVFGVIFVIVETINRNRNPKITQFSQLSYKTALIIGLFQVLSLVPGTSRSGVTIIGAMIIGCSRYISAEFTFFMAIPIMFGASGLKIVKYILKGATMTNNEWIIMITGCVVAYVVSILTIKLLLGYIKKHDFEPFGYYRIVLGAVILAFMFNDAFTTLS